MKRLSWLIVTVLVLVACGSTATRQPANDSAATTNAPTAGTAAEATDAPAPTSAGSGTLTSVKVGLDWTPNTNHTGLYVAQSKGYYRDNGLNVDIVQAQEGGTVEQLVAAGKLDFGISYQEGVTLARVENVPIVSIAAIIQHNTSGFASRKEKNITSSKDFEGKKYGAFGSPTEQAVIKGLMDCVGADFSKVQFVDIGSTDFFVATERGDIDFAWVFKGWTGAEAEQRNIPLNIVMMNDLKCIPDYYTPVIITSEKMISEQPDVVRRFMAATSAGYQFAIANPSEAADMLVAAAPELDKGLVQRSQAYLSQQYQADAPRWGEQRVEVWRDYAQWMADRKLLARMIEPEKAFTNQFLSAASAWQR